MAGFEVVVRPAVLPNIRPASARVLPPQDDPTKDICVIGGSSGGPIDLPYSFSVSYSSQDSWRETRRQFDKERVYQVEDDGKGNQKINKANYVEVERINQIRLDGDGTARLVFEPPPPAENVELIEKNMERAARAAMFGG